MLEGHGRKITLTHRELVARADRWLRGTMRCYPVFCESTSCAEAPDVIGWRSQGSVVVECKVSIEDLRRERAKYIRYQNPVHGGLLRPRKRIKHFQDKGYIEVEVRRMGTQRFILCPQGIISPEVLERYAPGHGLLYLDGRRVRTIVVAPMRDNPNYESEIRLLRLHFGRGGLGAIKLQPVLFEKQPQEANLKLEI